MTVDIPISVGQIVFDNANAYTIAGSNAVTLDAVSGVAQINVTQGSHTISAPVTLADDTMVGVFQPTSNLSLTIADRLQRWSQPEQGRRRNGNGATRAYVTDLSVNDGTLAIGPNGGDAGTSVVEEELSIGNTAKLDLNNNDLIVRAGPDTTNDVHEAVQADIVSAQNGVDANFVTKWDGPGFDQYSGPHGKRRRRI